MGRPFKIVAGAAATVGAVGALVAGLAGLAGGRSAHLDIFNHLAPLWLLAGVIALGLAVASLRGVTRLLVGLCAALAVALAGGRVVPELAQRRIGPSPPGAERLKLVQFNAFIRNPAPARSVDWLIAQQADIVIIEEGLGLPLGEQQRLLRAYPHCTGCDPGDSSTMILSKRPPLGARRFERTEPGGISPWQGGWATFTGAGGPFTVVGVHLVWPWLPSASAQHRTLARFVSGQPKARLILAGDLNMTPWSSGLRRLDGALGLSRVTHGQASWPAPLVFQGFFPAVAPIDQVYVGPGWTPVRVARGPSIGSDHYPIVVELAAVRPERPRP